MSSRLSFGLFEDSGQENYPSHHQSVKDYLLQRGLSLLDPSLESKEVAVARGNEALLKTCLVCFNVRETSQLFDRLDGFQEGYYELLKTAITKSGTTWGITSSRLREMGFDEILERAFNRQSHPDDHSFLDWIFSEMAKTEQASEHGDRYRPNSPNESDRPNSPNESDGSDSPELNSHWWKMDDEAKRLLALPHPGLRHDAEGADCQHRSSYMHTSYGLIILPTRASSRTWNRSFRRLSSSAS